VICDFGNWTELSRINLSLEQVSVQKQLLEREGCLYETLLDHWKNSRDLAASGLVLHFSAPHGGLARDMTMKSDDDDGKDDKLITPDFDSENWNEPDDAGKKSIMCSLYF